MNGEVATANMETIIKLLCWTCWKPVDHNAEFFINSISKDNVRLVNDKCYNSKGECTLGKCMCVSRWTYKYELTYKETRLLLPIMFSCEMRFKDNNTGSVFKKRAAVEFDGIDFEKRKTITNIIVEARRTVNVTQTTGTVHTINDSRIVWVSITTTSLIFVVAAISVIWLVIRKMKTRKICSEDIPLMSTMYDKDALNIKCTDCPNITSYAYCHTCSAMKCENCTLQHIKKKEDHTVIQIADKRLPLQGLYCDDCKASYAANICIKCNRLLCNTAKCRCEHYQSRFIMPLVDKYRDFKSRSPDNTIKFMYTIAINKDEPATRIRGVEFLTPFTLAVLDYGNWKILLYKNTKENVITTENIKLENEPRAMVRVSPDKLAVTYAYQRQIVIVNVNTERKTYILLANIGKPYSIAYMNNHFAVEIGEGEDGMIVIVDMKGNEIYRIDNIAHMFFFTGNTIRLALDMSQNMIYASTMGTEKEKVICVNLQSKKIVWKAKIPSPRSVILVMPNSIDNISNDSDKSILLCSKNLSTVYKLNSQTGEKDVLMDETNGIRSPGYMSYFQTDNEYYLAIEMENACIKVFQVNMCVGDSQLLTVLTVSRG